MWVPPASRIRERPSELEDRDPAGEDVLKTIGVEPHDTGDDEKVHVPLPVEGLLPGDYMVTIQEILPEGEADRGKAPLSIRPLETSPAPSRPGTS